MVVVEWPGGWRRVAAPVLTHITKRNISTTRSTLRNRSGHAHASLHIAVDRAFDFIYSDRYIGIFEAVFPHGWWNRSRAANRLRTPIERNWPINLNSSSLSTIFSPSFAIFDEVMIETHLLYGAALEWIHTNSLHNFISNSTVFAEKKCCFQKFRLQKSQIWHRKLIPTFQKYGNSSRFEILQIYITYSFHLHLTYGYNIILRIIMKLRS